VTDKDDPRHPVPGEFLVYAGDNGQPRVQVRISDGTVWLAQRQMADLYQVSVPTMSEHLRNIYEERELSSQATIRKFLTVRTEGNRSVSRLVDHYSLPVILSIGYRVRSAQGTRFRQWATTRLDEYLVKGFVMDDERLKTAGNLGEDYFEELLERIRGIRASERRFYQKITDIYAQCSVDYDPHAEISQTFYATVQNKMHWAVHGHTAAEVIHSRADATKRNMGLTTWRGSPARPIRKADVAVAKNYLSEKELGELNRIVGMYLDFAEDRAQRRNTMTMGEWVAKLDSFLKFNERNILSHAGKISHGLAVTHAEGEYEQFRADQKRLEATQPTSDFDRAVEETKKFEARTGKRRRQNQ
jgi:hypothetical protein